MGFSDKDIVALSGGHTVGSCHETRSGFDGPWTSDPVQFDNEYFRNLLEIEWEPREWDGPLQYTDPSGKLMMLPTDIALTKDEEFMKYVQLYSADKETFFKDFASAFGKLIALGCPAECQPGAAPKSSMERVEDSYFRECAMHGNLIRMKEITGSPNPNSKEQFSLRTPLHKACYFGHSQIVEYLLECGADVNAIDVEGDTPLHDCCKLNHVECAKLLLDAGAVTSTKNKMGQSPSDLAKFLGMSEVEDLFPTKQQSSRGVFSACFQK